MMESEDASWPLGVSPMLRCPSASFDALSNSGSSRKHSPVRPPSDLDVGGNGALTVPQDLANRTHEVKIVNWPRDLTMRHIEILFKKHGLQTLDIQLHRADYVSDKPSFAFVELCSDQDVRRAIDQLHGGKVMRHQIAVHRSFKDKGINISRLPKRSSKAPMFRSSAFSTDGDEMYAEKVEGYMDVPSTDVNMNLLMPSPAKMPKLVLPGPDDRSARGSRVAESSGYRRAASASSNQGDHLGGSLSSTESDTIASDLPLGASAISVNQRATRFVTEDIYGQTRSRFQDSGYEFEGSAQGSHFQESKSESGFQPAESGFKSKKSKLALRIGHTPASMHERVRQRLHAPTDVVVANFPAGTGTQQLLSLFAQFAPSNVRIMVNSVDPDPDNFTYAYVSLPSRMSADEAIVKLDGCVLEGRRLVVEIKNT